MKKYRDNILIVDDNESIRTTLQFILMDNNYNVESVENGKEAIEKVKEKFFNIAILDYRLPDVDGVILGKNIREINNDIEVIILTGKASLESAVDAMRKGLYDYLIKPVDPENLIKTIDNALKKQYLIMENKRLLWELKKSNKELERLNNFKDGLISIVSHDLRSPITSLKGFNKIFLDGYVGKLTEKQREIIEMENNSIDTMMEIINNVLDTRQIDAGKFEMKKKLIDIKNEVIIPVVKRVTPQINEKKLKVDINCEEDLPKVNLDCGRISQVIQNLLQNAIKFTSENGKIDVNILRTEKEQLEVQVKDTGRGISVKDLDFIFEAFYTKDDNKKNGPASGRGLGLAICKQIIKAHNGTIWAESKGEGKGSIFIFIIPISDAKNIKGE